MFDKMGERVWNNLWVLDGLICVGNVCGMFRVKRVEVWVYNWVLVEESRFWGKISAELC